MKFSFAHNVETITSYNFIILGERKKIDNTYVQVINVRTTLLQHNEKYHVKKTVQ